MATCRSCGAMIRFIQTPAGKWLPCNPEKVSSEDVNPGDKLVMADGEVVTVGNGRAEDYGIFGYVPHWATCPDAESFKRGRQ